MRGRQHCHPRALLSLHKGCHAVLLHWWLGQASAQDVSRGPAHIRRWRRAQRPPARCCGSPGRQQRRRSAVPPPPPVRPGPQGRSPPTCPRSCGGRQRGARGMQGLWPRLQKQQVLSTRVQTYRLQEQGPQQSLPSRLLGGRPARTLASPCHLHALARTQHSRRTAPGRFPSCGWACWCGRPGTLGSVRGVARDRICL